MTGRIDHLDSETIWVAPRDRDIPSAAAAVDHVASSHIETLNPIEQLKGTNGRYGITDYLKFKIGMFFKRCICMHTVYDRRQEQFYKCFNALKGALHSKLDQQKKIRLIQKNYEQLVKIARSWTRGYTDPRPYEEAVLNILKDELSEQTTKDLLHDFLLREGTEMITDHEEKISLLRFTDRFDYAVEGASRSNYGTVEEAKNAFLEAAARTTGTEEGEKAMDEFMGSLEEKVTNFLTQNFESQTEVWGVLYSLTFNINELINRKAPITQEALVKILETKALVLDPEQIEKLVQICQEKRKQKEEELLWQKRLDDLSPNKRQPQPTTLFQNEDFPAEIKKSIALQIHPKTKAREKERMLKSLEMAYRISEVKAVAGLCEWENTFNGLNASLQKAYLESGRVIVRFNSDQLRMIRCKELESVLRNQ